MFRGAVQAARRRVAWRPAVFEGLRRAVTFAQSTISGAFQRRGGIGFAEAGRNDRGRSRAGTDTTRSSAAASASTISRSLRGSVGFPPSLLGDDAPSARGGGRRAAPARKAMAKVVSIGGPPSPARTAAQVYRRGPARPLRREGGEHVGPRRGGLRGGTGAFAPSAAGRANSGSSARATGEDGYGSRRPRSLRPSASFRPEATGRRVGHPVGDGIGEDLRGARPVAEIVGEDRGEGWVRLCESCGNRMTASRSSRRGLLRPAERIGDERRELRAPLRVLGKAPDRLPPDPLRRREPAGMLQPVAQERPGVNVARLVVEGEAGEGDGPARRGRRVPHRGLFRSKGSCRHWQAVRYEESKYRPCGRHSGDGRSSAFPAAPSAAIAALQGR